MSNSTIVQQPQSSDSIFQLMPDEYIRFEYIHKPGCCCFSSKTTTVTNMRLITRVIQTPTMFSRKSSTGKEKRKMIFLSDINNSKQLQSAIPSNQNKWWMKCINILTCRCSNQRIDWFESYRDTENLAIDTNEFTTKKRGIQKSSFVERF